MLSVTLDTSCCLDLYRGDASPDADLVSLMRLGLRRRVDIGTSEVVGEEIGSAPDPQKRALGLDRLQQFPTLLLPSRLTDERVQLTATLISAIFPRSTEGTRQYEHNERDCRQLAIHKLLARAVFVTLDMKLWRKRDAALLHGIRICTPAEVAAEVLAGPGTAPVEATIAARPYLPEDQLDVRRILASLGEDYPNFDGWITKTLGDERTSILVGTVDGRVAGAVIWKPRGDDGRAVKLASFRIDDWAQDSGLGSHMLFHALRSWVDSGYKLAYVTVSSRRAELVRFFAMAGFMVQGVSPIRYADDASEIVMGKLILRESIGTRDLEGLADRLGSLVFGRPGGSEQGLDDDRLWFLPPSAVFPSSEAEPETGQVRLFDQLSGRTVRQLTAFDLETLFYPLRVHIAGRQVVLVPIQPEWADRMLTYPGKQERLFDPQADPLLIRADNAYYCFPRCLPQVAERCRILFYVTAPVSAIVGEAIITESVIDYPEVLHQLFGDLGIYAVDQIGEHIATIGPRTGLALALRFSFYLPFREQVSLRALRTTLRSPRFSPH